MSITKQLFILATKPEKGGFINGSAHLRFSLAGALMMDFLNNGEILIEEKRLIPKCKENGDSLHDSFVNMISTGKKPRRVSYWVRRAAMKYQFYITETGAALKKEGVVRIEEKSFLRIFRWKKYRLTDKRVRSSLIERLRGILLHNKEGDNESVMLIALIPPAGLLSSIAKSRDERRKIRARMKVLCEDNEILIAVRQAITEIQVAVATTAATSAGGAAR